MRENVFSMFFKHYNIKKKSIIIKRIIKITTINIRIHEMMMMMMMMMMMIIIISLINNSNSMKKNVNNNK
jgi:hypothetical protein